MPEHELKGPLHGVPITIKDNLDTAGIISTGGTKGRKFGWIFSRRAMNIRELLAAITWGTSILFSWLRRLPECCAMRQRHEW
jgi:hypothetical protein